MSWGLEFFLYFVLFSTGFALIAWGLFALFISWA
jgi:hypothetical protein